MKMQDKELDELFRSNLDDLEFNPSPGVWAGIDAELENGRHKKSYIPFLSIAASIIVLFTIGYLFIPKKARTIERHAQAVLPNRATPVKENVLTNPVNKVIPAKVIPAIIKTYAENTSQTAYTATSVDSTKVNPVQNDGDEQLTAVSTNNAAVVTPVLPDENTLITSLQPIQIKSPETVGQQQTIAQVPAINDKRPAIKPKHPALSLGSLINAMVAKVDKRQDKIIEFTDDDGDSNITGVNLGIIKLKKDQQTSEK